MNATPNPIYIVHRHSSRHSRLAPTTAVAMLCTLFIGVAGPLLAQTIPAGSSSGSTADTATATAERRVALVVGNAAYQAGPLTNPVNDAGDVAEDGRGRNSTFTTAFLHEITKPDLDGITLFNGVGAAVRDATNGGQIPTIHTEPLSRTFVFNSSELAAAPASEAAREPQAELTRIEQEIAARQRAIAAAHTTAAAGIRAGYAAQLAAFDEQEPEIWETDDEFTARLRSAKQRDRPCGTRAPDADCTRTNQPNREHSHST